MDIGRQSAVDFLDIFVWAAILGSHSHIRIRTCASVTKQYNLKPAKGRWYSAAVKLTAGLADRWSLSLSGCGNPRKTKRCWIRPALWMCACACVRVCGGNANGNCCRCAAGACAHARAPAGLWSWWMFYPLRWQYWSRRIAD